MSVPQFSNQQFERSVTWFVISKQIVFASFVVLHKTVYFCPVTKIYYLVNMQLLYFCVCFLLSGVFISPVMGDFTHCHFVTPTLSSSSLIPNFRHLNVCADPSPQMNGGIFMIVAKISCSPSQKETKKLPVM